MVDCIRLGENIQRRAHSDAIPTLKHWLTILEARWAEVKNLSSQRRKRLRDSLDVSQSNAHLLDELTKWMSEMEATLKTGSQKPIPENIPIVEQLLQDHAVSLVPTEHLFWSNLFTKVNCLAIPNSIWSLLKGVYV